MKRRVLVGQALVHRPPVIILDEPTAGVDVELRQGLWKFIRELNSAGHTIVLGAEVFGLQFLQRVHQRLGHVASAELTKVAGGVGQMF